MTPVAMAQLIQHANIRQREFTLEETAIERADLSRVEAIELPDLRDVRLRLVSWHADYCRQKG